MSDPRSKPTIQPSLLDLVGAPDEEAAAPPVVPRDQSARDYAVDPAHNVVLEASAGTGKTAVLTTRYLRLLEAGVDPAHVLAITFTRKAAAEMRDRIVGHLRREADRSPEGRARWRALRDRLGDVAITTIDAFCFSLLKEFPLEAGLSPDFVVADETETARLVAEAIDEAIGAGPVLRDRAVALLMSQMSPGRIRGALAHLLDRRHVAPGALAAYVDRAPAGLDVSRVSAGAARRLREALDGGPGGLDGLLATWPTDARFALLGAHLARLRDGESMDEGELRGALRLADEYFLTRRREPRKRMLVGERGFASRAACRQHGAAFDVAAPRIAEAGRALARDVNVLLARGLLRLYAVARGRYEALLAAHDALDFSGALERAVRLLAQMEEFAQSRYRLESRYHHVLVDEFQDTNPLQWELVARLIESWGAGAGLLEGEAVPPTIFVVGDRKQSIYRFRDADARVVDAAARFIAGLREDGDPRRAISHSFRAHPSLLSFVNAACGAMELVERPDAFRYGDDDRFPDPGADPAWPSAPAAADPVVGVLAAAAPVALAEAVASEIGRVMREVTVRDRQTGVHRAAEPGDIAILLRTREGHRLYEQALERRGIPTYVYKGLGFFDADEVKDLLALVRFLADPSSPHRTAAVLRSRLLRLSDAGLLALRDELGRVLSGTRRLAAWNTLSEEDRALLALARPRVVRWVRLVDRVPPAELVDDILQEAGYAFELRGPRRQQAQENVKKLLGLVRRLQNRGYATMGRVAAQLDRLSLGDESNAAVDAVNAVNVMTVHASKGLEFPVVVVANLGRGAGSVNAPLAVLDGWDERGPLVSVDGFDEATREEEERREREESKRLLYVALTRARDRLYLAGLVDSRGALRASKGSLAEVIPGSLRDAIASSAETTDPVVTWTTPSGEAVRLAAPGRPAPAADDAGAGAPTAAAASRPAADVEAPLVLLGAAEPRADHPRLSATAAVAPAPAPAWRAATRGVADSGLVAGRIVHRLFQARLLDAPEHEVADVARTLARELVSAVPEADGDDTASREALVERAVRIFVVSRDRADVRAALDGGAVSFEVPFSTTADIEGTPSIVRGVVDCLVERAPDDLVILEFKTGRPAGWHRQQVETYAGAIARLRPGARVAGEVVYLSDVEDTHDPGRDAL